MRGKANRMRMRENEIAKKGRNKEEKTNKTGKIIRDSD